MADLVAGDTGSKIVIKCRHKDGSNYDLTGKQVLLKYRIGESEFTKVATIKDPPTVGEAEYSSVEGDLIEGIMYLEAEIVSIIEEEDEGDF